MKSQYILVIATVLLAACGEPEPEVVVLEPPTPDGDLCAAHSDCSADTPYCSPDSTVCEPAPASGLIGWGDGSPESVEHTLIYETSLALQLTDIDFNPEEPDQLWLLQRPFQSTAQCTSTAPTAEGCGALEGVITIVFETGTDAQSSELKRDPNGWHFLRRPTGLAFGANSTFATIHEARTGNYLDDSADFIGPTLWSSDLMIFAQDPGVDANGAPLNGSHLDMLHATPWGMGIAHERDNVYWVFNGNVGSLDRYDFKADHGAGYHDHSDGEIQRFIEGELQREPGVPSHMFYEPSEGMVYVADSGNSRVVRVDPSTSTMIGEFSPVYEPLARNEMHIDARIKNIVAPGVMSSPSGMAYDADAGVMYVSDNATGRIHAFDLDGEELRTLKTPLSPGHLGPLTIGPDGKLYYGHLNESSVWRIDVLTE